MSGIKQQEHRQQLLRQEQHQQKQEQQQHQRRELVIILIIWNYGQTTRVVLEIFKYSEGRRVSRLLLEGADTIRWLKNAFCKIHAYALHSCQLNDYVYRSIWRI